MFKLYKDGWIYYTRTQREKTITLLSKFFCVDKGENVLVIAT